MDGIAQRDRAKVCFNSAGTVRTIVDWYGRGVRWNGKEIEEKKEERERLSSTDIFSSGCCESKSAEKRKSIESPRRYTQ